MNEFDKARAIFIDIQNKRTGIRADEERKHRKAIFTRLDTVKPQDWNNIPIPVQDGFLALLAFSKNVHE